MRLVAKDNVGCVRYTGDFSPLLSRLQSHDVLRVGVFKQLHEEVGRQAGVQLKPERINRQNGIINSTSLLSESWVGRSY